MIISGLIRVIGDIWRPEDVEDIKDTLIIDDDFRNWLDDELERRAMENSPVNMRDLQNRIHAVEPKFRPPHFPKSLHGIGQSLNPPFEIYSKDDERVLQMALSKCGWEKIKFNASGYKVLGKVTSWSERDGRYVWVPYPEDYISDTEVV